MTLNKFCPVAQGEYYNNKSPRKSQHFFPVFLSFFFCLCNYNILRFIIVLHTIYAIRYSSHHLSNFKLLFYTIKTGIAAQRFLLLQSLLSNYLVLFIYEYHISPHTSLSCSQEMAQRPMFFLSIASTFLPMYNSTHTARYVPSSTCSVCQTLRGVSAHTNPESLITMPFESVHHKYFPKHNFGNIQYSLQPNAFLRLIYSRYRTDFTRPTTR